jgi:phage-related protein
MIVREEAVRELMWVGSSQDDLRAFPEDARRAIGFALRFAQNGTKHPGAKPLKGFGGAGVLEIVADDDGDTFRAVYTVTLPDAIYVLHAFQKKSSRGIMMPQRHIELIRQRLKRAEETSAERMKGNERNAQ